MTFRFMLQRILDRRQGLPDAGVVGDLCAVFAERHIEVNADEDMFVLQIEVADRQFWHSGLREEAVSFQL